VEDSQEILCKIPTKMSMTFKFFTFQELNTTELKLIDDETEEEPRKVEANKSYGIVRVHHDENQADLEDRKA